MKLVWEYFFENINTNNKVATLKDDNETSVITVYQDVYFHRSEVDPKFYYIDVSVVFFGREKGILLKQHHGNLSSLDDVKINEQKLIIGCNIIKEDFERQLNKYINSINKINFN